MSAAVTDSFDVLDATIAEIHAAMDDGALTAESLVSAYLRRIETYDDDLNAILSVNDGARERARTLDEQFDRDGFQGPLHGIPILLKDNQDTHDMPTTAGSVALSGSTPPGDAFVVERLREAGAIVLGKTNLQELSFGVDTISSLGGETRNAYDEERRPSGSSGGTAAAIAANLATVGTGTDTCSSVRSPPAFNALVGVRPTMGLVSRTGIVPLCATQDTAGPIARTVEDAARTLAAIVGFDPDDPITARGVGQVPSDGYVSLLDADGLDGARIGVVRQLFGPQSDEVSVAETEPVTAVVDEAIDELAAAGASIVDPVDIGDVGHLKSARVLHYEFARDFDAYLSSRRPDVDVDSLASLVASGTLAPSIEARFDDAPILGTDVDTLSENVGYLRRLARRTELAETTLATMASHDVDALCYPPSTVPPVTRDEHQPFAEMNCELAAHTGLPAIVVPAGYTDDGLPVGLELLGRAFDEGRLFELAYAYEQESGHRRPPERFGPIE
ncbi:amidase [Halovivax gelatinilyticus]|uniref:amidase n=1 Tax=Halovivax gelatinilyticus TaxID=2961597 RepID=UPI0020CA3598|nr:amidase family protein [Halovivax gelatinilyticus]